MGVASGWSLTGASNLVIFDGGLAVALITAYVLCEGWTAWSTTSRHRVVRDLEPVPATIADRE